MRSKFALPLLLLLAGLLPSVAWAIEGDWRLRGKPIYTQMCAECHGETGEGGTDGYADPLVGDLSVAELAEIISDTMPEDDPDRCVDEDAEAVAAYIHDSFYGPAAQTRRNPPQLRLARLTGNQLRQTVADLHAHFGDDPWTTSERGISGNYFNGQGWGDERLMIRRTDDQVDFDFDHSGPGQEIDPRVYYIHWNGSLLAPRSGLYEIVVRSSCSFTMQFGRLGPLFFDNHVQSAGKDEFRQTVHLTGGRVYPIKIDLQQRPRKTEQPPVRISLRWVPPGGSEQVIPQRYLLPEAFPSSFALQTKLPPDDASYGYPRGIAVDRTWDQSITDAALEFADVAIDDLFPAYAKRRGGDQQPEQMLRDFLTELVEIAFRGPVDEETRADLIDGALHVSGQDHADAIRRAVLTIFKSPRFLYPTLDGDRSRSQRAANRLALVLYDSLPAESWLRERVDHDRLQSESEIRAAAVRMAGDFRTRAKLRDFLYHWLDLAELGELTKDETLFPGFDNELVNELKLSFDAFLDEVVESETSDFRQLLQADWALTSPRIADFYGAAWQPDDGQQVAADYENMLTRTVSDGDVHVGVLTHPLMMSHFAYHKTSSPIHRGVFLSRYLLGRVIRPPQAAFNPLNADLHPDLTTRQRVELQTNEINCQVCHQKINSLGFALEQFDAVGRFRTMDGQQAVDPSGSYQPRVGPMIRFNGARELGATLASNADCQQAFVESAFEYFVKQPIGAYGNDASQTLLKFFHENDYNMRDLIVQIATIAASRDPSLPIHHSTQ